MNFRKVTKNDISTIIEMMVADDELGKKRDCFQNSLPNEYVEAFERINADKNQKRNEDTL